MKVCLTRVETNTYQIEVNILDSEGIDQYRERMYDVHRDWSPAQLTDRTWYLDAEEI